jgi:hypothetical protein
MSKKTTQGRNGGLVWFGLVCVYIYIYFGLEEEERREEAEEEEEGRGREHKGCWITCTSHSFFLPLPLLFFLYCG